MLGVLSLDARHTSSSQTWQQIWSLTCMVFNGICRGRGMADSLLVAPWIARLQGLAPESFFRPEQQTDWGHVVGVGKAMVRGCSWDDLKALTLISCDSSGCLIVITPAVPSANFLSRRAAKLWHCVLKPFESFWMKWDKRVVNPVKALFQ